MQAHTRGEMALQSPLASNFLLYSLSTVKSNFFSLIRENPHESSGSAGLWQLRKNLGPSSPVVPVGR